jgi:peptide-methionine (S)-S-oxide reductase
MFGIFSDKKSAIPTASEALPGRSEAIAPPAKHYVNGHPMNPPYPAGMETAVFGFGCFWGAERKRAYISLPLAMLLAPPPTLLIKKSVLA